MSRRTDLEAQGFKTYENEEISIFWNPSICQHAPGTIELEYNSVAVKYEAVAFAAAAFYFASI